MTQEELDKIPEASRISYKEKNGVMIPIREELGCCFYGKNDPMFVLDENGDRWTFAMRLSDNTRVKVKY